MSTVSAPTVRREFREGDVERIVDLHRRVYVAEYERNDVFIAGVQRTLDVAVARDWPHGGGGVWLVDHGEQLSGSVALTDEGDGRGRVRWVVFGPELRGRGLGRRLIGEMLEHARGQRYRSLELETFSALRAAAHLYRSFGFAVTWEQPRDDWGPPIVYQHYELRLR